MSDTITGTVYIREQVGGPSKLLKGRTMYMVMGVIAAPKGIFPNETQLPIRSTFDFDPAAPTIQVFSQMPVTIPEGVHMQAYDANTIFYQPIWRI